MAEEPLYQDERIKIDYLSTSPQDHLVFIEGESYLLQRGLLKELAKTPRGGIESKIDNFNCDILFAIKKEGISVDGLHVALCQTYAEEESRFIETQKSKK